MAREITPEQAAGALEAVARALPDALRDVALHGAQRIGQIATGAYMQNGQPGTRRSPGDSGPLRIVSGALYRAVIDRPGSVNTAGGINRIETNPTSVTLEKGVDLAVVPYARIHERGGVAGRNRQTRIPARPYLGPALDAAEPEVRAFAEKALTAALMDAVGHRLS